MLIKKILSTNTLRRMQICTEKEKDNKCNK